MTRQRIAVPVLDWPAHDLALWQAALQLGDEFDPAGGAAHWRPSTRDLNERCYGHWLAFLVDGGRLDPEAMPHERCTKTSLAAYLESLRLRGLAPMTVVKLVHGLLCMLEAMCADAALGHLVRLEKRLKRAAVPTRNKAARLLSPREVSGRTIAELERLSDEASSLSATQYRDTLAVALLTHRPIRRANLVSISLGRHLTCRNGVWICAFAADETKTHRRLHFDVPVVLTPYLERYLTRHRPRLLRGRESPRLWISSRGTPLSQGALYGGICSCTRRLFGAEINPHLFRDIAATFVSEEAPEDRAIVADILGHTTLATSQAHYDHASSLQAQQRLLDVIDRIAWYELEAPG